MQVIQFECTLVISSSHHLRLKYFINWPRHNCGIPEVSNTFEITYYNGKKYLNLLGRWSRSDVLSSSADIVKWWDNTFTCACWSVFNKERRVVHNVWKKNTCRYYINLLSRMRRVRVWKKYQSDSVFISFSVLLLSLWLSKFILIYTLRTPINTQFAFCLSGIFWNFCDFIQAGRRRK